MAWRGVFIESVMFVSPKGFIGWVKFFAYYPIAYFKFAYFMSQARRGMI